jgi:hypothetical protein
MLLMRGFWVVAAAALATTVTGEAWAGYQCECAGSERWTQPGADAEDVPVNARIFVSWLGLDLASLELQTQDPGSPEVGLVAAEVRPSGGLAHQVFLVPEEPLLPNRAYWLAGHVDGASTPSRLVTFETGSRVDEAPPRVASAGTDNRVDICESHVGAELHVSEAEDDGRDALGRLLFRLDFSDDDVGPAVTLYMSERYGPMVFGELAPNGRGTSRNCLFPMAGVARGTRRVAQVVALDWAGHEYLVPQPLEVEFTSRQQSLGCDGCSAGGGTPLGNGLPWLAAVVALLVAGRGRAREGFGGASCSTPSAPDETR